MTDSTPETNPSPSADTVGNGSVPAGNDEKVELAFIRERLPALLAIIDDAKGTGYVEVPDRAALAQAGVDLAYMLGRAEARVAERGARAEVYINEDDAPRRWRKIPVPHGPEHYARMARTWGLVSVLLAGAHIVLYLLDRAG